MEWAIPLQKLEVGKIQVGKIIHNEKSFVPLAYFDGNNSFPHLNILLPLLTVSEYDVPSGKLLISFPDSTKISALENSLLTAVFLQQKSWFPSSSFTYEMLQQLFKPIVENSILNLYFPVHFMNEIKIYKNGVWYNKYEPGLLQKDDKVRIMFRIQGISFHKNYNKIWSGKFRLQHRILAILVG